MSARKLGRFAGLVFVLAVVFGGVSAVSASASEGDSMAAAHTNHSGPAQSSSLGLDWD